MRMRAALIVAAGLMCAGCSSVLSVPTELAPAAKAFETGTARDPAHKTLASKVLSAIAIERVTGRKPDPATFVERN